MSSKSLTQEVDELAISILRMTTGRLSPTHGGQGTNAPHHVHQQSNFATTNSANISTVSAVTNDDTGRSPVVGHVSPRKSPLVGVRQPALNVSSAAADGAASQRVDARIAAILTPPSTVAGGLLRTAAPLNSGTPIGMVNSRASPLFVSAAAPTSSMYQSSSISNGGFGAAVGSSSLGMSPQQSPAPPSNSSRNGIYEATAELVAQNMTRLVRSAALLEAESLSRLHSSRHHHHGSPLSSSGTAEKKNISPSRSRPTSPLSQTQPPLPNSRSVNDTPPDIVDVELQLEAQRGRELAKDFVHELHMLELRLKREMSERERQHERDQEAWHSERDELRSRLSHVSAQVEELLLEKKQLLNMLEEASDARMGSEATIRDMMRQLQEADVANTRDGVALRRQNEMLRAQIERIRDQRNLAERNLTKQGHDYALLAEQLVKAEAKVHVLQGHVHKMHVRDQQKDEQLHDVAVFVKKSLAPFVVELESNELASPTCRKCKRHHAVEQNQGQPHTSRR